MAKCKLASNIERAWRPLSHAAYYRGAVEPVAICLSPSAAAMLGVKHALSGKVEIIDTWAWGWSIRMADGTFRP